MQGVGPCAAAGGLQCTTSSISSSARMTSVRHGPCNSKGQLEQFPNQDGVFRQPLSYAHVPPAEEYFAAAQNGSIGLLWCFQTIHSQTTPPLETDSIMLSLCQTSYSIRLLLWGVRVKKPTAELTCTSSWSLGESSTLVTLTAALAQKKLVKRCASL